MSILADFVVLHSNDDIARLLLDKGKYPEIDMTLAVNCIESRRKLKGKVQEWHDRPELIFPLKLSAEQCSSSATGRYKALLAESIIIQTRENSIQKSDWKIADLTGGLGVDSWFFSKKASSVIYNEMQSVLCDAARYNFSILGAKNIEVSNTIVEPGSCGILLEGADIVYMDPARRGEGGKKVFLIEDCTPDILTLKDEIFSRCRHILVKLSPMADISMVCDRLGHTCREVHIVSTSGECKELLIWMDREWNAEYTVTAVELHNDSTSSIFTFRPSEENTSKVTYVKDSGNHLQESCFLFEPGKSMMKAGAFNLIAERLGISKLGKSTHYYTTASKEKAEDLKGYGKLFSIKEIHPLNKRTLKEIGKRYPKAEVTARNIPMETDTLRKRMGVASGGDVHIFGLHSDTEDNILIVTTRI